ncbi:MAG: VOC family protein [Dehalococcoidia bacterium]
MAKSNPQSKPLDMKTEVELNDRIVEARAAPTVKLPPLSQIGWIVKDVDKSVEYFSSVFGIGPWRVVVADASAVKLRGKTEPLKVKVAFAQHGPVEIEFLEVLEGGSLYTEFLRERGEGVQHLGFGYVEDLQGKIAELAKDGYKPAFYCDTDVFKEVYLESKRPGAGGVCIQLREMKPGAPPEMLAQLAAPPS